jgi:hypothetical protein
MRADLFCHSLSRYSPDSILHSLVALIHRIFLVDLYETAIPILDGLAKTNRRLVSVCLFQIASAPTQAAEQVQPVPTSATWEFIPVPELPLVLAVSPHFRPYDSEVTARSIKTP